MNPRVLRVSNAIQGDWSPTLGDRLVRWWKQLCGVLGLAAVVFAIVAAPGFFQ